MDEETYDKLRTQVRLSQLRNIFLKHTWNWVAGRSSTRPGIADDAAEEIMALFEEWRQDDR